jgi:FMN hydrolase / 5-amino-6-(5-phospho-D-ribitylamino)uracil phosphatase
MKKANIKIISIDLFRTIVDIDQTSNMIWELFLKNNYSSELSRKYQQRADEINWRRCDASAIADNSFKTVRNVLEETISELFSEIKLDYSPKLSANKIIEKHCLLNIFPDAKPFLERAGQNHTVCLSTDADVETMGNIGEIYLFDNLFVSEELQVYKLNPRFFKHVINHYSLPPSQILHIGDSKADIITPKQLGIQTCWLNRRNLKWDGAIKPDFEVNSLLEILDLLD